jgi:hypothetical protein
MKKSRSTQDADEARRLLPPVGLPGNLAPTPQLVSGIRLRMARRAALAARRARFLRAAGILAACAALAVAIALGTGRAGHGRGTAEFALAAEPPEAESDATALPVAQADGEEEAFLAYEKAFGTDPNEEAFEALDTLISALECDFASLDWQSL